MMFRILPCERAGGERVTQDRAEEGIWELKEGMRVEFAAYKSLFCCK